VLNAVDSPQASLNFDTLKGPFLGLMMMKSWASVAPWADSWWREKERNKHLYSRTVPWRQSSQNVQCGALRRVES